MSKAVDDRLKSIRRNQEFRNKRQAWTAGEEQDRQDIEWLLDQLGASQHRAEGLENALRPLIRSSGPFYIPWNGTHRCVYCRGSCGPDRDEYHALGCAIMNARAALAATDAGGTGR